MSVKLKTFKLKDQNDISKFLKDVKIIENGIIVSDGNVSFLHKENADMDMDQTEAINAMASGLAKEQKAIITQVSLIKLSEAMLDELFSKKAKLEESLRKSNFNLDATEKDIAEYKNSLDNNKKKYDQAVLDRMRKKQDMHKEQIASIEKSLSKIVKGTGSANNDFYIEAQEAYLQQAIESKRAAELNVRVLKGYIEELQNEEAFNNLILK
jgi:enterochelin esterase-like enzyme